MFCLFFYTCAPSIAWSTRQSTGEGAQLPSGVVEQPQPPSSLPAAEYATRGANASPVRPIPMTSIVVNGRPHEDGVVSPTVHSEIRKLKLTSMVTALLTTPFAKQTK